MKEVTYPIYVMKLLGMKNLIVTNACGGINRSFVPGDLMILTDYIHMLGRNPLIGENDERLKGKVAVLTVFDGFYCSNPF